MTQPVAITAKFNYTRPQAEALKVPRAKVAEYRALLRRFHDELTSTLSPRIEALRTEGLVLDHASSWLLGEFVAHVPGDRVGVAIDRLGECPELKEVMRAPALNRAQRRKR